MKVVSSIFLGILTLVIILLAANGLGWLGAGSNVVSAGNVKAQWAEAYKTHESLGSAAFSVCSADKALANAITDGERIQRQTQLSAYEQNYARIAGEYNAQMADGFRAKYVKPGDLPDRAETLSEAKATCAG
ncbi:hypothetical protein HOU02_gp295 [Caulobacter phage CcrBL9]|uniref:Uncharacterized protein n=1 Tax=Caulobacter phage CcrBL9 TaxID=2283270 RepID=A0A385ECQ3_9CAUD|nr:hypothetical protein HOU02_gp295 [Caulobacter phage CcrBL9]AXQ69430.1 hypothetical protein CcrBL9_gp406 [Caulobacter phage CcrBL9]